MQINSNSRIIKSALYAKLPINCSSSIRSTYFLSHLVVVIISGVLEERLLRLCWIGGSAKSWTRGGEASVLCYRREGKCEGSERGWTSTWRSATRRRCCSYWCPLNRTWGPSPLLQGSSTFIARIVLIVPGVWIASLAFGVQCYQCQAIHLSG